MKGGQREAVDRGAADAARRAAGEQGDPPADGSARGDDPGGVVVVDAARLFTVVAGGPRRRRLNRPSPLWPRPTGSALATTGGLLVNPKPTPKRGQFSTLDTYPAATRVVQVQPALTRLPLTLEEALWIKRSQRVRSFGERFAASVVSTSNSTADKRSSSARGTSSAKRVPSCARCTSGATATGSSHNAHVDGPAASLSAARRRHSLSDDANLIVAPAVSSASRLASG
jgi:hypothetical protein